MDEVPKKQPNRDFRDKPRPKDWPYGYEQRPSGQHIRPRVNTSGVHSNTNHPYQNAHKQQPAQTIPWSYPGKPGKLAGSSKKTSPGLKLRTKLRDFRLAKRSQRSQKTFRKKLLLAPALFMLILVASLIGTNFISNPQQAEAAIGIRGINSGSGTTGTSQNVAPNASTKDGDVMIATLFNGAAPGTVTAPGGWTSFGATCTSGSGEAVTTLRFWWRKYVTTDTNWTWSWGNSGPYEVSISSYSGVNNTTPIHATPGTFCSTGTGTSLTAGSITTTVTNTMVVGAWSTGNGNSGTTHNINPSPATEQFAQSGSYSYSCGLICTNTKQYDYSYSDSTEAAAGTFSRTASLNVSSPWTGTNFALAPATDPSLEQAAYRWLTNADSVTPGAALAATNTAITNVKLGDVVRLRMLLHVSTAELQVDLVQYKLKFATKVGGACGGGDETFSDVATASGAIRYFNNTSGGAADGATIATTANDPSHSGHTIVAHTYEEANNFSTRLLTPSGQDAMWDFALTNNSAPNNTTYCFKMTTSGDADINTYTVYPELTSINIGYEASAYRWFDNADSTTPGTTLAAQDTAVTQVNTNANFRLRMLIHNSGTDAIPVAYEDLKLQFAVQSGGSCSATPTGSYGDVATASGNIRYLNNATPADNATAVTDAGDPTHSGHTKVMQYYKEANNFTTRASLPAGQDGLWDFALNNFSAPFGTVYCFRAVKAADGALITNTVYPQLTIVNPNFEQAAYRWYNGSLSATPPGSPLAANNTPATNLGLISSFRLRMLMHISNDPIFSGTDSFNLEYATKSGGTCGSYSAVTSSGAVRWETIAPSDGSSISTTANDPTHGSDTKIPQTFETANSAPIVSQTNAGQDAMWDFALQTVSAPLRTTYCFRLVRTSGGSTTYTVTPEITTIDPRYEQSAYRWLTNADSTTPGAALAANNTPVTDISQNTIVRLRMLVHVSNFTHTTGLETFKLQFAQKSGTCDVAFTGETYADLATGSGAIRYYNNTTPADGAAISTNAGDPSHGSDTIRAQTYEEANNFTSTSQVAVGEDAMWDFAIQNFSAVQNTSWCFRLIKTDGTADFTTSGGSYTQIAELNTAPSLLNQSAYRWFQNVNIADMLTITNNPTASALDSINDTALDTTGGYIYLAGHENNKWRIEKRKILDAELCGAAECGTQFGTNGVVTEDVASSTDEKITAIAIDASGGFMYLAGYDSAGAASTPQWRIEKRNLSDGALVNAFDTNGILTEDVASSTDEKINSIVIDTSGGHMYLNGYDSAGANSGQEWRIEKRNLSDGALVNAFDTDGIITEDLSTGGTKAEQATAIVLDVSGGNLYVGGFDGSPPGAGSSTWRAEKRSMSSGAFGSGFGNHDSTDCNNSGTGTAVYCVDPQTGGNTDDRISALAIDSTYIFITGSDTNGGGQWRADRITLSNNTITPQLVNENPSGGVDLIKDIYSDATYLYLVGYDSADTDKQWLIEKRKVSSGNLCTAAECTTAFDTDGIIQVNPSGTLDDEALTILVDTTNARMYTAGYDQTPASGDTQWRIEKRKTLDGSRGWEPPNALVAQDTKTTLISGVKFRLRMTAHVSGENMAINAETLKLQMAQKIGTCDSGFVGETYADVGTSGGDISYYNNTNIADAASSVSIEGDPSHSGHTNIPETYEEANNFTFPIAVNAGQDALWDFALIDNSAFGNYCFRIVKSDGNVLGAYSVIPEVVFCDRPKTENLIRHGNFFCDDGKKKLYWN
ncbi:MAG: hypothetical protein V4702_01110 [Patescibacteria group bacterium]